MIKLLGNREPNSLFLRRRLWSYNLHIPKQKEGNSKQQKDNWSSIEDIKKFTSSHYLTPSNNLREVTSASMPDKKCLVKSKRLFETNPAETNPGEINAAANQATDRLPKTSDSLSSWEEVSSIKHYSNTYHRKVKKF